jgi:hypothetical protein
MSDAGAYEHERARLHALADRWIDALNTDPQHVEDCRIEVAVIGGILRGTDPDGDDAEAPAFHAETRSMWQQVGLFSRLLDVAETGHEDAAE